MLNYGNIPRSLGDGRRLPIGKSLAVEYDWQVGEGSNVPSWLALTGAATYTTLRNAPAGCVTLTTTNVANNTVSAKLAMGINSANVQSIELLIDGLRFDLDDYTKYNVTLAMHNDPSKQGMYIQAAGGSADLRLGYRIYNVGGNVDAPNSIPYILAGADNGQRAKSVGMAIAAGAFGGYFIADDEIIWGVTNQAKWVNGIINPGIEFQTREAVAHFMQFSRFRVRVYV